MSVNSDAIIGKEAVKGLEDMQTRIFNLERNDYYRPIVGTGVTSNPPTQGEITAILGSPTSFNSNVVGLIKDTTNNREWIVFTDKTTWYYVLADMNIAALAQSATGWVDDGNVVRLGTATDNVSIGSASPLATTKLYIEDDTNNSARIVVNNPNTGTAARSDIYLTADNGSGSTNGYSVQMFGSGNTSTWSGITLGRYARFRSDGIVNGLIFTTGGSAPLIFGTNDTERVRILSGGYVGFGVTSPSYRIELPNTASASGQGRANAWQTYSDNRIKANQSPLLALDLVLRMNPIRYNPVNTSHDDNGTLVFDKPQTNEWRTGIVAQELHEIAPELVRVPEDDSKDLWTVDYNGIVPLLVSAIKEQNETIDSLLKRVEALENK